MSSAVKLESVICQNGEEPDYTSVNGKVAFAKRLNVVRKILEGFRRQGDWSAIKTSIGAVRRVAGNRCCAVQLSTKIFPFSLSSSFYWSKGKSYTYETYFPFRALCLMFFVISFYVIYSFPLISFKLNDKQATHSSVRLHWTSPLSYFAFMDVTNLFLNNRYSLMEFHGLYDRYVSVSQHFVTLYWSLLLAFKIGLFEFTKDQLMDCCLIASYYRSA